MEERRSWSPLINVDPSGVWDLLCEIDPDFAKLVGGLMDQVMAKGALEPKTKALIRLGIVAAAGLQQGTANVAELARGLGAMEEEIKETVQVAFLTPGLAGLATGMEAFLGRKRGQTEEEE